MIKNSYSIFLILTNFISSRIKQSIVQVKEQHAYTNSMYNLLFNNKYVKIFTISFKKKHQCNTQDFNVLSIYVKIAYNFLPK